MKTNDEFFSEFMKRIDMTLFTPSFYKFLVDFLKFEKVRKFNGQYVINTFIPPFPGKAFDRFLSTYFTDTQRTPIQSVDLAVTNGCVFNCWHCYNAGRLLEELPTESMQRIVRELQKQGAIVINFTGGEPCLRRDIVEICSMLRKDSCGILATTGYGFTDDVAQRLRETGVYSICISLDSANEREHDQKRGLKGAFNIALKGIETAKKWGFYVYTCAVPLRNLLQEDNFQKLVELNIELGVDELQLIEPAPAGKLLTANLDYGKSEIEREFQLINEYNQKEDRIAITSFLHMESPEFFGCGAGHSHIYVDGSGEVSPCNMIPISYGNAATEDMTQIIDKMQFDFQHPCSCCLAYTMRDFFRKHIKTLKPASVDAIPSVPFPDDEELPHFFRLLEQGDQEIAGEQEIKMGYNKASSTYEDYWLSVASAPIDELFKKLKIKSGAIAIDCGCGTGYSTIKLAEKIGSKGKITAIDLSPGMVETAQKRAGECRLQNIEFRIGDVLDELSKMPPDSYDIATLTWLIGYVGCQEIFPLLRRILRPGGVVGFVAHLDRSPQIPIELFEEIIREEPQALIKAVNLKFPMSLSDTVGNLRLSGFKPGYLSQGIFTVNCANGREVFDHVMKSGAGTTFYYSLKPSERERLSEQFIKRIDKRFVEEATIPIIHEYLVGTATASEENN
jgi:MoaA/NifB/PqqE/SkfB family radical SAM enzyme/ubiquinone/menaquinone biosynthesis C-methylase UbiE